jgi:hypothetical protein
MAFINDMLLHLTCRKLGLSRFGHAKYRTFSYTNNSEHWSILHLKFSLEQRIDLV